MAEPIKNVTLGGVTYNANLAKGRPLGGGKFMLKFNSGETLTYSEQSVNYKYFDANGNEIPKNKLNTLPSEVINAKPGEVVWGGITKKEMTPTVTQRVADGLVYDDNYFDISNVMGATFKSHKDAVSHVKLIDCNDTKVNLAANSSRWYPDEAEIKGGSGNEIILDNKDKAIINNYMVEGKGIATQKDYE